MQYTKYPQADDREILLRAFTVRGTNRLYHLFFKHCDVGYPLYIPDECNAFVQQYPNESPGSSLPGPRSLSVAARQWLCVESGAPAASMDDVKAALQSL